MKNLLIVTMSFFSASLAAQNFQLSVGGGLIQNGVHNNSVTQFWFQDADRFQTHVIATDLYVKAMYVRHNYQFGITADYRQLTYKTQDNNPYSMIAFAGPIYQYTDQDIPVKIFVNRVFRFNKIETYAGLSMGYMFINSKSITLNPFDPGPGGTITQSPSSPLLGAQIGGTYFVTKRLGINLEVAGEYVYYPGTHDNNLPANIRGTNVLDRSNFTLPATVGVRYRF